MDLTAVNLRLFGFSQGVTMICRLAVYKQLPFKQIVLWAGGTPHEQHPDDWYFIDQDAQVDLVIGDKDQFFSQKTVEAQTEKVSELLGMVPRVTVFEGKHEVTRDVLAQVAS